MKKQNTLKIMAIFLLLISINTIVFADHWYNDLKSLWKNDGGKSAISFIKSDPSLYMVSLEKENVSKLSKKKKTYYIKALNAYIDSPKIQMTPAGDRDKVYDLPKIRAKLAEVKKDPDLSDEQKDAVNNTEQTSQNQQQQTQTEQHLQNVATGREPGNGETGNSGNSGPSSILPDRSLGLVASEANGDTETIDDMMGAADGFLDEGNGAGAIEESTLQNISKTVYDILSGIAIVIAVIIGLIIGIKFMLASAEEKAEIKKTVIPYIIGCFVTFGAFGIWKLILTVLNNIE